MLSGVGQTRVVIEELAVDTSSRHKSDQVSGGQDHGIVILCSAPPRWGSTDAYIKAAPAGRLGLSKVAVGLNIALHAARTST